MTAGRALCARPGTGPGGAAAARLPGKNNRRESPMKKPRAKKKGRVSTIILLIVFFVGLSVLLYPTVSDWWNSFHQSRAIVAYTEAVSGLSEEEYEALWQVAEDYNAALASLSFPFTQYDQLLDQYEAALDLTGNGIMGYITIGKIDVELPIYHGTSSAVLNVGVGHLEGTYLPIGGEGTHCVLSAHRGLPRAKLFSDLDQLEVGDCFEVTILNETLTYEVDQILIVEPDQMEALGRVSGEDYLTLMTCTPYGINTHRLLVRGRRTEAAAAALNITDEARQIDSLLVMPAVAIPLIILLLGGMLVKYRRKKKRR